MALIRTILILIITVAALTSAALFLTTPIDVQVAPEPTPIATSTVAVQTEPAPTAPTPELVQDDGVVQPIVQTSTLPPPTPQTTAPAKTGISDAELNSKAREALVNIFCTTKAGGEFKPLSGSGVMISSKGVVLTNAHVGQYYLLRDYRVKNNIDCVVRTGSPATARYRAELLYISPEWIAANAEQINTKTAKGTGENDYAFLLITEALQGSLPSAFPALEYKSAAPTLGERMLLAAYPAGFLSGEIIATNLYPTTAFSYVTKLYTFDNPKHTDLFSIGGSVISQSGSSGGASVRADGTFAGLITTALLSGSTTERDLRAITVAHIERSLAAAGQSSITTLLSGNLLQKSADFNNNIAPGLTKQLEAALKN